MSAGATPANPTQRRVGRAVRNRGSLRYRATGRDILIVHAIARLRFATTTHAARLFFDGSRSAANNRLRVLFNAEFVTVLVCNLASDNIYAIAPAGRRLLHERNEVVAAVRCPRTLDGNLGHLLSINNLRVDLAVGLPQTGGEIAWWRSDWELRAHRRQRTIPDALFAVHWPDIGERVFALEVEHRTRAPRSFLVKMLGYRAASYRGGIYGESDYIVLVVGHSPTWLPRYRAALAGSKLALDVWFASIPDVEQHGAAGAIWQAPGQEERLCLRDLATRAYRKHGTPFKIAAAARLSASSAAHRYPSGTL